jgi:hypothetical protein
MHQHCCTNVTRVNSYGYIPLYDKDARLLRKVPADLFSGRSAYDLPSPDFLAAHH